MVTSLHKFISQLGSHEGTPPLPTPGIPTAQSANDGDLPILALFGEAGWYRLETGAENPLDTLYNRQSCWAGFWHLQHGFVVLACRQNPWQGLEGLDSPPYRTWQLYKEGDLTQEWHELLSGALIPELDDLLQAGRFEALKLEHFLQAYVRDDLHENQLFQLLSQRKDILAVFQPVLYQAITRPIEDQVFSESTAEKLQYTLHLLQLINRLAERRLLTGMTHILQLNQAVLTLEETLNRLAPTPLSPLIPAYERLAKMFRSRISGFFPAAFPVSGKPSHIRA